MAESYTGVIDRVVDGETAVILVEGPSEPAFEVRTPLETLPGGAAEGDVLDLELSIDVVGATIVEEETERRKADAQERFDNLSQPLSEADSTESDE